LRANCFWRRSFDKKITFVFFFTLTLKLF
jgi:hypothetical protein